MIELRGNTIGMVPQDPMSNLNPVWKIGFQVKETLKANGLAGDNPKKRVAQVLADAGVGSAQQCERRARAIYTAVAGAQLIARTRGEIAAFDELILSYREAGLIPTSQA